MDKRKGKILEAVLEKEEVGPSKVGYNKSSEESEVEATLLKMLHQEQRKWKMWKTIKEFPQKEAHQQTKRVWSLIQMKTWLFKKSWRGSE